MKRVKKIKSFEIGSYQVQVLYQKKVIDPATGDSISGLCDVTGGRIFIATHTEGEKNSNDYLFHSVCHELSHFIMELMGQKKLYKDEKFIDGLGLHIAQFYKSAK